MSRPRRALAVTVALTSIIAGLAPARADGHPPRVAGPSPGQQVADRVARGEALFADQEYQAAIKTLTPVTRDRAASRAQRVRAWEVIALARFILGDEAGARDAFERVLELDPGFQLRDSSGSPRIRAFFDRLRREVVPGAATGDIDLEHAAPAGATAGGRLELEVRVSRGATLVHDVAIVYRALGVLTYREAGARAAGADRWRAAITLPAARERGTFEYYVVARAGDGVELARIAAPDTPLTIAVAPGGSPGRRPWYGRWYVIAGVALVAAGATGAIVAGTGGLDDGSLPPGTITVTP